MKLKNPSLSGIKNIIFDFGGVIADIDVRETVKDLRKLGLSGFDAKDIHPENTGIFLALELGNISNEKFYDAIRKFTELGVKPPTDEQIRDAWNGLILDFDLKRFELLDKLRENYKIYLLSNTNLPHRQYFIAKFNKVAPVGRTFESYFDRCFYSDEMHMRKPAPEIYQEVLDQAGIKAAETLFVDDNAPNLTGAETAGLKTYHMTADKTLFEMFE